MQRRMGFALFVSLAMAPLLVAGQTTAQKAPATSQKRAAASQSAPAAVTSPKAEFGFNIGDDYHLANYTRMSAYMRKLERESNRIRLVEYGKSSEGRPMLMAIITSPENFPKLDHYKQIARRLALAENLTDEQAHALAREGKSVVWVDGGLHASEIANSQTIARMAYEMATRNDLETMRILKDDIFLLAFSNPDGLELVANWYMREKEPTKRSMNNLPVLYQKYIGHDNNRESLLANMPESSSIARVLYTEWFPQIMYNQHQTGPAGAVLFIGAMRDPTNPNLDPLMAPSTELVSAAIHSRFVAEGKPGAMSRSGASYQNWWNGGIRSTVIFHNQIGILSEITGNPTPTEIAFVPKNQIMGNDNPYPVAPQKWHFGQAIDYLVSAERAILDIASVNRENFLFNIYRMGKNQIDRGSRDNWTMSAHRIQALVDQMAQEGVTAIGRPGGGVDARSYPISYFERLKTPATRDARGYIISADQPDFLTATKFVNALIKNGVAVHRATQSFQVAGKSYPAGSYVVKTAQAFRPHVVDCFEPQDYPDDFAYPGGPPIRPYDVTGYTLAYQMGVQFDRVLEALDGPFEKISGFAKAPAGTLAGTGSGGYLLSHQVNDAFKAINQLLAGGEEVYWLKAAIQAEGKTWPAGTIYITAKPSTAAKVQKLAASEGLTFQAVGSKPVGEALKLKPLRVGVVDVYGGSMPSGWVQWLLPQYGFTVEVVFPPTLDAGDLSKKFDVIVLENGIMPGGGRGSDRQPAALDPQTVPAEYRGRIGAVTAEKTAPQLKKFLEEGGSIVTIGNSASLARMVGVVLDNALTDEKGAPLPGEKFYMPGSILQVRTDPTRPLAYGMPEKLDIFYDNTPVFKLNSATDAQRVAWFDSEHPTRSGWAWGEKYLNGGVIVTEATVGKGKLVVLGPLVAFRAHPHGTFKFLFNGLYYGSATTVTLGRTTNPDAGGVVVGR